MKLTMKDIHNLNEASRLMQTVQDKNICSGISDLQEGRIQTAFDAFEEVTILLGIEPELCEYHVHDACRINEEHIEITFEIDAKWEGFTYYCLASEAQVCKFFPRFEEVALRRLQRASRARFSREEADD